VLGLASRLRTFFSFGVNHGSWGPPFSRTTGGPPINSIQNGILLDDIYIPMYHPFDNHAPRRPVDPLFFFRQTVFAHMRRAGESGFELWSLCCSAA